MHPAIDYEIAKARLADSQRQADQAAIAHAARQARLALAPPAEYPAAGLARCALSLLAARGWLARGRPRPLRACPPSAPCATCG